MWWKRLGSVVNLSSRGNRNWVSWTASSVLPHSLVQFLLAQLFNHVHQSLLRLWLPPGSQAVGFTSSYTSVAFRILLYLENCKEGRPWNCIFLTAVPPSPHLSSSSASFALPLRLKYMELLFSYCCLIFFCLTKWHFYMVQLNIILSTFFWDLPSLKHILNAR